MTESSLAVMFDRFELEVPHKITRWLAVADRVGTPIDYLGLQAMFDEVRVYRGVDRDWVLAPAELDPIFNGDGRFPIPKANLNHLKRLVASGLDFPAVYMAHDVPPGVTEAVRGLLPATTSRELTRSRGSSPITADVARLVVPPAPPPAATLERSARYGVAANAILKGLTFLAASAIGLASAPLVAIPSMFSAFADFTDPVIFGALPLGERPEPGQPAAWFVLTSWSY